MATSESKASDVAPPRVILGTMTYGGQTDEAGAKEQLEKFADLHKDSRDVHELDTARMYSHGETEEIIGRIFDADPSLRAKYIVASKVNPFKGYNETLSPESVRSQSAAILTALKHSSTDILYLHAPDLDVPIERTLEAVNDLYRAGAFRELGLSNYPAWGVAHIWHLCHERGWVKPTVYQGMYNAITRDIERELIPCLRTFNMRLYVYNPLAGGVLTGKHTSMDADATGTRFDPSNKMYRDRFWRADVFAALDGIRDACKAHDIHMAAASLQWVMHHSDISGAFNDGMIIGASGMSHLESNIAAAGAGPLPDAIVKAFDAAWDVCRPNCPKYFRP